MIISPDYAHSIFTDLTQSAAVPLAPNELTRLRRFQQHGHVFFGDVALRRYKYRGRWGYDERDIRRAGRTLADVPLDLDDVVEVRLPAYRDAGERDPEDWCRPEWRRQLMTWMFDLALRKHHERPFEEREDWKAIGESGLPGGLTWEEFVEARNWSIAGTLPLQLLTWSEENWLLPRAYAELMDRWEQRENELVALARICSSCGARGPYWGGWRTSTSTGYVTMCPPCSGAAYRQYTGHLNGRPYESVRQGKTRADDYLCQLCGERRASVWDHCHEHDQVRGPLCASCNTSEGTGFPYNFLQREGSVLYLLECRGCREQRTLPHRYHIAVSRAHVEQTERHGRCSRQPYTRELDHAHGVHRYALECNWHTPVRRWTASITTCEAAALVRAFVDTVLTTPESEPPGTKAA
ncbi:endonuclease domain-containing protein [Streptomyces sp. Edi2]|uniref:endonuclease domain-containing protein n=1 Tax=Streptomyces sp. Edi2 TaxID=3162528 RepID=UPI003306099E